MRETKFEQKFGFSQNYHLSFKLFGYAPAARLLHVVMLCGFIYKLMLECTLSINAWHYFNYVVDQHLVAQCFAHSLVDSTDFHSLESMYSISDTKKHCFSEHVLLDCSHSSENKKSYEKEECRFLIRAC